MRCPVTKDFWPVKSDSRMNTFAGTGGRKILRLRDDNTKATIDLSKISATHTDSTNGATETVTIDFR